MFKALLKAARMKKSCPSPADIVDRIFSGSAPGTGPPFGRAHRFHQKNSSMGVLSSDARSFTKKYNKALHKKRPRNHPIPLSILPLVPCLLIRVDSLSWTCPCAGPCVREGWASSARTKSTSRARCVMQPLSQLLGPARCSQKNLQQKQGVWQRQQLMMILQQLNA